jgi:anthranilate phosphoribosyltransferase
MESLIELLNAGSNLTPKQVKLAVSSLVSSEETDGLKMEFLKSLRAKGETAEEIAGFAKGLLALAVNPELDRAKLQGPTLDVCGTGGDRQGFFNVSTGVMFIAAACGACVLKHGNRSATSKTGAADVLEELGVKIDLTPTELRETLEAHGVAFIFAPVFHPAFKMIAPVRKALAAQGIPTIFNLLGPLLNPAQPDYQLAGLFHSDLLPKYAEALRALGRQRAWAVHGSGTDELSLTGPSEIHEVDQANGARTFTIVPEDFGLARCAPEELRGGERPENARILMAILDGTDRGPKRDMVLLNAAAACVVCELAPDLATGLEMARRAIDSGAALGKLNALRGQA